MSIKEHYFSNIPSHIKQEGFFAYILEWRSYASKPRRHLPPTFYKETNFYGRLEVIPHSLATQQPLKPDSPQYNSVVYSQDLQELTEHYQNALKSGYDSYISTLEDEVKRAKESKDKALTKALKHKIK